MEARLITIIDTRTNSVTEIESAATTVAELKADLNANRISVEDMTIQEGLTKVEFMHDNAILPTNIPYRGGVTNKLVIRLTKTNKKIESGITRKEIYEIIKKEQELAAAVKEIFGTNYTHVPTEKLAEFLSENSEDKMGESKEDTPVKIDCPVKKALELLVNMLYDYSLIYDEDVEDILSEMNPGKKSGSTTYSQKELNEMFSDM